jgi:outer membrane lipoprotein-sorting protein
MKRFLIAISLFAFVHGLSAQTVETVLARLDATAPAFHGMGADLVMVTFTAVISDTVKEKGSLQMQKAGSKDVRAIIQLSGMENNDKRTLAFTGSKLRMYFPNTNQYQDIDLGKKDVLNQFLLLGFGSSGKELSANYNISLLGPETIGNTNTSKLQLIPKDPKVLERLKQVEMWMPVDGDYPVQQKFYEPSGNFRLVTYTNLQPNPAFGKQGLVFKLPPGATQQQR